MKPDPKTATKLNPSSEEIQPKRKRRDRRPLDVMPAKMDLTPMIDVVFLLLVFFLCATRFKTIEDMLNANMPDGGPHQDEPPPIDESMVIHIAILDDDNTSKTSREPDIRSNRKATYLFNGVRRVRENSEVLTILNAAPNDASSRLYPMKTADTEIPFSQVVRIMDLCYMSGKTDIKFMAR